MVHIHNVILLSHKKEHTESVLMRRMKLEPIIQSEVSRKKDKYNILKHIYMVYKDGTDGFICKAAMKKQT